ncbi:Endosomal protein P24B [Neolecta irregularis DAH-3]|uniref:Endosomal protein P24B n=1 Tax=Neolecta irregularis (strain DAH-3) TaxID=1198029 RepID=A0A1U7LN15_NEOID|nr:Endosomal protein P24B [Neolecta irregularis DAH-3]|eukprot:OLL24044.1 Endosomal protein P24B [Neolecta irregularis DAH-3]
MLAFPVALFLFFFSAISAHLITLGGESTECFFENLHKDDKLTVSFQTDSEDGEYGIRFHILDPAGRFLVNEQSTSFGEFQITSQMDGTHKYCFQNVTPLVRLFTKPQFASHLKFVSFNVHGVVYVSDEDPDHQDPMERQVRELSELLEAIRDEQEYIVARERMHRNTAESTNSRVKWWSLIQSGIIVAVSVFQIYWLKRFFEVKRVV